MYAASFNNSWYQFGRETHFDVLENVKFVCWSFFQTGEFLCLRIGVLKNCVRKGTNQRAAEMMESNLIPRVFELFGQRVSGRRDPGIMAPFSQKTRIPVLLRMLEFKPKQKREGNAGLKVFEKRKSSPYTPLKETGEMIIGLEDETSDAFGKCIFSVSACIPSCRIPSCKQHDKQIFCGNDTNVLQILGFPNCLPTSCRTAIVMQATNQTISIERLVRSLARTSTYGENRKWPWSRELINGICFNIICQS